MRRILYVGVFSAGLATMAVELSASRLLGNYFGSSNLVWAAIIGLILIYLSAGYSLGGKWADKHPDYKSFFKILVWAGFFIGIIPVISRPILRFASAAFDNMESASMIGAFASVLILFSIPVTLLGTASPFAVRLAFDEKDSSGKVAGRIYTISTVGSFIGTFLPVLLLIPLIGTYRTFISISLFLLVIALVGMLVAVDLKTMAKFIWMPLLILLLAFLGLNGFDKQAEGIILETESAYNYIQVQEINDYHILRLNEGQGIHSIYHPTQMDFHGPWEQVLTAPFFNSAPVPIESINRIAILGLAAGTSANQIRQAFPEAVVDGFEIDPSIIHAGFEYFGMQNDNLNVHIADARWGIAHEQHHFDVISIDAYTPPYIPWHLTTVEFFTEVYEHLQADGVMVINVARIFEDRALLNSLYATIDVVFPYVYVIDLPGTLNSIIFASRAQTHPDNLVQNYIELSADTSTAPLLLSAIETAVLNQQPLPVKGIVMTDDKAPVEWITNGMIVQLLFSKDIQNFQ